MKDYYLAANTRKTFFSIPKGWRVLRNAELAPKPGRSSIGKMVNEAIERPLGTSPLRDIVKPDYKIVIIVDDIARQIRTGKPRVISISGNYVGVNVTAVRATIFFLTTVLSTSKNGLLQ